MKITFLIRRIVLTRGLLLSSALMCGRLIANSEETSTVISKGRTIDAATTFEGTATHYTRRGQEKFSVGYYLKDGATIKERSLLADKDGPVSKLDFDIVAKGEAFNSVIATGNGTDLTLTGTISASDHGDGKNASDFSGLGAQIIAADYAKVKLQSMKIDTAGFLRGALICDNHAQVFVEDSTITTMGANPLTQAWKGYVNSANQNIMLSPPWVLGIQGGVRAVNMIGNKSTLTVINSAVTSGGWAVLSTDEGNSSMMNVVDTTLAILPASKGGMSSGKFGYSGKYGSGYGTYVTGNAHQNFYGVTFNGLTYAGIYTGGEGTYRSSTGNIELKDAEGQVIETVAGKGKPTTINSVFGFMSHGQGTVNVLDGTVVNTEEAVFLAKTGGVNFLADGAVLNSSSGTLLQMIDNDDRTVGGGRNGFKTEFNEASGWPSENGNVTKASTSARGQQGESPGAAPGGAAGAPESSLDGPPDRPSGPGGPPPDGPPPGSPGGPPPGGPAAGRGGSSVVKLALLNGNYKGNAFNGSGYYTQSGKALEVSIGKGATLSGAISLTETRHVDETGKQNTHFTINEYYYLGHVANRNYRNGSSTISVSLKDGGVWKVTGESLITKLTAENGSVEGASGAKVVMKNNGKEEPIERGKTYSGNIVIALAD